MIILGIETARDACSVALEVRGTVRASMTLLRPRKHAERLIPMVLEVLSRTGVSFNDLDAVAVSEGPGSYTGLRIGVSAAKGLCLALGAKLVGVPTAAAYARAIHNRAEIDGWSPDITVVALRSRRGEVYFDAFQGDDLRELQPSRIMSEAEAAEWVNVHGGSGSLAVGGDGVEAIIEHLDAGDVPTQVGFTPNASYIAVMGREALLRGEEDDLDRFEPYYLKDYVAKRPAGTVFDRLQI